MADFVPATDAQALAYLGLPAPVAPAPLLTPEQQAKAYLDAKGIAVPGYTPELPASNPATASAAPALLVDPVRGAPIGTAPGANPDMTQRYAQMVAAKKLLDAQAGVAAAPAPEAKPAADKPRMLSPELFRQGPEPTSAAPPAALGQGTVLAGILNGLPTGGAESREIREGGKQIQQGLREQEEAAQRNADASIRIQAGQAEAQRAHAQRLSDMSADMDRDVKLQTDKLAASADAFTQPSGQVDPNRFWNSRTTGQKVAAFISAFATGFSGRPDVVQGLIDADVAAQRDALDRADRNRTQAYEARRGVVGAMRERFQDSIQADRAVDFYTAKAYEAEVAAQAARATGATAKASALQLLGEARQATAAKQQAFIARSQELAYARTEHAYKMMDVVAGLKGRGVAQAAELGQAVDPSLLTPEQRARVVVLGPGRAVLAPNAEYAKQATEKLLSGHRVLGLLDQAIGLRKEYGSESGWTDAGAAMQTLGEQLKVAINKAEGLGTMDADTTKLLERAMGGDLGAYGQVLPKLQQLRNTYTANLGSALVQYTGHPDPGAVDSKVTPAR